MTEAAAAAAATAILCCLRRWLCSALSAALASASPGSSQAFSLRPAMRWLVRADAADEGGKGAVWLVPLAAGWEDDNDAAS